MAEQSTTAAIHFDGRTLEGGGQLLRIALCLSALRRIPIQVTNIRGNRSGGGGLKNQHLTCAKWLARACNAEVEGAELKSKSLIFRPAPSFDGMSPVYTKRSLPGDRAIYECAVDIGSAGSTALALQAVLPYILFTPPLDASTDDIVRLHVEGGTNVSGSPSYEYITQVLLPVLSSIGLPNITARLVRRGWSIGLANPGSFVLDIPIRPQIELLPFELTPSDRKRRPPRPSSLRLTFLGPAACHAHLRAVVLPALEHYFGETYSEAEGNVELTCEDSRHDKRLYLIVVAVVEDSAKTYRLASDWLYDRKIRLIERSVTEMAERVTSDLFAEWNSGAWVDEHMRDQLVIFAALSSGDCSVWEGRGKGGHARKPSLHAQTAQWVADRMLERKDEQAPADLGRLSLDAA